MKKFLSMVLALALSASLFTVGASAKDFTDDSKITYNEAVDVISEIGVVDGYTDGSFGPTTELTRGAAAKIICNLLLGPTTASALGADTAPYKDVPTSNVFAGYIAYCKQQNIISGYADGSFRPAAPLTGYAFMKMLLGALGYDSAIEGYTGANWSVAVAKQALNIGLDDGNDNFVGTKAVTREEAALYAFNMLQADMVEYDSKTQVSVGGATVVVGSNKAESRKWESSATKKDNIKKDDIVQFAEEYFNKLVKSADTTDVFGRPATRWDYKGVKVGTYANKADKTYVGSVKLNAIYNDLGMSTKDETANIYVNGVEMGTTKTVEGKDVFTATEFVVSKSNDKALKDINTKVGDGTIVEVYRDDDNNHVDIIAISVYGGKVASVKAATSKKDAYVTIEKTDANKAMFKDSGTNEFETTDFSEDDIVAFTFSEKENEIETMYKMDSVEGSLTKKIIGKSITLGDTTYKYAKEYTFDGTTEGALSNKSDYTVYTDANGYALYIEETDANVADYAVVLKVAGENATSWVDGNRAKMVFSDGSVKTVTLNKDYTALEEKDPNYLNATSINGTPANGDTPAVAGKPVMVTYKVESDGEYKLTVKGEAVANSYIVNKSFHNDKSYNADSKTVFVVNKNGKTDDYNVYTGIKNAPTITAADKTTAYVFAKNGVAKIIYFVNATSVNTSKDVTFIAARSVTNLVDATDTDAYYQYNAVVKGEITTIMVKQGASVEDLVVGDKPAKTGYGNAIVDTTTTDDDDIITVASFESTVVSNKYAQGIKRQSDTEVKVGTHAGNNAGSILALANDAKIYLVDTDGNIEKITVSDIVSDPDNHVSYTMEDGEITNLFIQEVDD